MSANSEHSPPGERVERRVVLGRHLHARPAGQVAQAAARHRTSSIELGAGDRNANARSVLAVMGLGALKDSEILVVVTGPDADSVADEVAEILGSQDDNE
jgi:phosphocarrier protein HPr